jgi:hypothetical protein
MDFGRCINHFSAESNTGARPLSLVAGLVGDLNRDWQALDY